MTSIDWLIVLGIGIPTVAASVGIAILEVQCGRARKRAYERRRCEIEAGKRDICGVRI